ncbi:hypothetical protein D3C87_1570520 [compost metagenome]
MRLLFKGWRMAEGFQRFVQLSPAHRDIDPGFFQRRIGIRGFLGADAFKGRLHRVECRFNGVRRSLQARLAIGCFLFFFTLQTGVALFEPATCMIAFGGPGS